MKPLYGGIEFGGTKTICMIGHEPRSVLAQKLIATETPAKTMTSIVNFFNSNVHLGVLDAIGIGSFGPIDLKKSSATFGHILKTSKKGWSDTNILGPIERALKLTPALDTDVGCAALAEGRWGAATDLQDFVYITVGTGIGGSVVANNNIVHGALHSEIGHMYVPQDLDKDKFSGICPFHGNCVEGLASGPSIAARLGSAAELLDENDPVWPIIAEYLSYMCVNVTMTTSPRRIILGGGLMQQQKLFPLIHSHFKRLLNNYLSHLRTKENIAKYIVPAGLGPLSGCYGALALAADSYNAEEKGAPAVCD